MADEKKLCDQLSDKPPDIFFRISTDGQILFISDCVERLTGFSPDDIKSCTFWELFAGTGHTAAMPQIIFAMLNEKGRAEGIEMLIKTRDNSPFMASLHAYYFRENDALTIEGSLRDISNLPHFPDDSEKITAAHQSAAAMAHEINNLLTSASLSAQLIEQKLSKSTAPEAVTQKLARLQKNIDKAALIAKNLMSITRTYNSEFTPNQQDRYIG
ncbi:PAS domain-containing protein [Candidatus Magnetominusculus xianensis]|uniref:histidine kinase n=1 Tax=Candidatus Magnetominusculus xianensis TaxID=1748249 RepID=A0ABR5SCS8_9BACT|nr:PAS domain-containing protein [Candidatus Magnetominusculus xianensis]KWT78165.1 PAS domain-containing sensor histidine kinase [Candidatus Magnetominusculus xianensis]MBF0404697.1 PAS domain-containing protein [Nitrospirota bacterium]